MTDDLIARIETQLASVVTSSAGTPTEKTIRDYGRTPVCREDIEALIASYRALEAQAVLYKKGVLDLAIEIGGCTCGEEYTGRGLIAPDCAWHQASTPEILEEVGLMDEYRRLLDAALAARKPSE